MALEELRPCCSAAQLAKLTASFVRGDLLVRDGAEELADPKASGVAGRFAGWKDVVRTDHLGRVSYSFIRDAVIFFSRCREPTLSPYETQVLSPRNSAPELLIFSSASLGRCVRTCTCSKAYLSANAYASSRSSRQSPLQMPSTTAPRWLPSPASLATCPHTE